MGRGRAAAICAVSFAAIAVGALTASLAFKAEPAATAPAPQATAEAAQPVAEPATPDPHHGKAVSYTCLGCHGIEDYKNAYPMYSVPELRGQNAEYLVIALHGYRDGDRSHITMHSQTESLSEQDMADVAAYLAGTPLKAGAKAEGSLPSAAQTCVACHGQDGVAIAPMYPSLAGQHEDYIERALNEYRHGGRKNPIMKQFAGALNDEDVAAIAAYFSRQTPPLATEPRPSTRLSE